MPRPIRHPKDNIILEYTQSFSSGPQASSTPTQDPSNITWGSDLSPIKTSTLEKNISIQLDTSPDPFGFQEIRGIHPTIKIQPIETSSKEQEKVNDETSSNFSPLQEKNPFKESSNDEDSSSPLSKHKYMATKPENLKYKKKNENDNNFHKKRKITKKYQSTSKNTSTDDEAIISGKDSNNFDLKKQIISSKEIIEYFKEVDKFELDVEDVPENYNSDY
ncbi:hypothetical protein PCANB_002330 [Pneumocystis canis]|nr:hypothetical protein PCK1_002421 [Pneumocystis canis]KAG5439000.1 hypothetical protein PCANB_002330 [Pneumocystis canis]